MRQRRASQLAALILLAACGNHSDTPPTAGAGISNSPAPGIITASPATTSELLLAAGDSVIDLAGSPLAPEAALLVRSADGRTRVMRWIAGGAASSLVADLPAGFEARGIAHHPVKPMYFVSGAMGGKSQVLSIATDSGAWKTKVVFETPRDIGKLVVSSRPFATDSGPLYRLFFATKLPNGGSSLRSVTEKGSVEYQVVGPASEAVAYGEEHNPGGTVAPFGTPMAVHPRGQPLLWQDGHRCAHAYYYSEAWTEDKSVPEVPCNGATILAPNGNAYVHWTSGRPGVAVIGSAVTQPNQASTFIFLSAPVSVPDGRGVIGIISKGGTRNAVEYVPLDIPLADVANAWQIPSDVCDAPLLAREGGLFRDTDAGYKQLYMVYDRYNYSGSPAPFLATTDLFWDNFGAAFNGVFIVAEKQRAMGAFWAFIDSAKVALSRSAPGSKWARAFAAISDSRNPRATGEAGFIARATKSEHSTVVDSAFNFAELMPRGHYTSSPEMTQYFRAVHYLTQISQGLLPNDAAPLAALPENVQRAALRWVDVYRPFISPARSPLVWTGASGMPTAPYSKHPTSGQSVFPLSWGIDNEVLESTVMHSLWPADEQIPSRLHPSGVDVAEAFGNSFARSILVPDLKASPRLGPVLDGITARNPKITPSSSVYERWLDALGAEWADSLKFPGAPTGSTLWDAKRLQTGLASWATLREATILVNERAGAAEAGEGGFESLIPEQPRGYVEPAPKTFQAIASLYESLSRVVAATSELEPTLRAGIVARLDTSAAEARRFAATAEHELRGQPLSDAEYGAIQSVAGSAEHQYLVYKSLGNKDEGVAIPDPMPKIADVAGDLKSGVLEAAVGNPLEWHQLVPYFGRREVVVGGVYSYHEFVSMDLYDNERWRKELGQHPHPTWIQPLIAARKSCGSGLPQ